MVKVLDRAKESAENKLKLLKEAGFVSKPSDLVNPETNFNIGGAGAKGIPALNHLEELALRKGLPKKEKVKEKKERKVTKPKEKVFGAKKQKRLILRKLTAASIAADPIVRRRKKTGPKTTPKLRKSITPGTVLIILAGNFAGKRVVFLKQLASGLLLVTGPFKLNGVPLRRVSPKYVIATSTKVDISGVTIDEKINDKFFSQKKADRATGEEGFFKGGKYFNKDGTPASIPKRVGEVEAFNANEERKALQEAIDTPLLEAVKKVEYMADYLKARFSLSDKDRPHEMKF